MADPRDPQPAPDIATGVANVIDAALGVGVALARVAAEATALGRPVEPVPPGTPALSAIVRYGVTAAGNLASALVSGAQGLKPGVSASARPAGSGSSASSSSAGPKTNAAAARAGGPRVARGATLRVPLSVENPSERAMNGLTPRWRATRAGGADVSALVDAGCVRFSPAAFDVAPHDFEKLTVTVAVPAEAAPGDYEVVFALGDSEPDLKMAFAVTAG